MLINATKFRLANKLDALARVAAGAVLAAGVVLLAGCKTLETLDRSLQEAFAPALSGRSCPGEGMRLCIQEGAAEPGVVAPGGTVEARLVYTVAGTEAAVDVLEERVLAQGGRQITRLQKETATRTAGTWETKLQFKVPFRAREGEYEVSQRVTAGAVSRQRSWYFNVRKPD